MKSPDEADSSQQESRVLLLVDDEKNILSSLKRLLHRQNYHILTASGGAEALQILAASPVDVIVSDQRMPEMTGVEFFRVAKELYPDTIRIMLSGYTELQSVTDAVNEGAIYKFLTKPWDDIQLLGHIAQAFRHKDLSNENARLNERLRVVNGALEKTNAQLDLLLQQKDMQIENNGIMFEVIQEALQHLPLAVFGLDEDNLIVLANNAAECLSQREGSVLGQEIAVFIPTLPQLFLGGRTTEDHLVAFNGEPFKAQWYPMGKRSQSRGRLLTLIRCETGSKTGKEAP